MSFTIYTVTYNFAIHAIYPMALMMYKYSELQMSSATENLSHTTNCKTTFLLIVNSLKVKKLCVIFFKITINIVS
jgi:hypothetical protein